MKKNINFSILVLILLLILQGAYFYKKSVMGYVYNVDKKVEENSVYNIIFALATEIGKEKITLSSKTKLTLLYNDQFEVYEKGILYLYMRNDLYPVYMPVGNKFYSENIGSMDLEYQAEIVKQENIDTAVVLSTNDQANFLDQPLTKQYMIFEVKDQKATILDAYDLTLYSLYEKAREYNKEEIFFQFVKKLEEQTLNYRNLVAMNFIYQFALDLYHNGFYDLAIQYSEFYRIHFNEIDATLNTNLGNIYTIKNKKEKAIIHYNLCLRDTVNCDIKEIQKKLNEVSS